MRINKENTIGLVIDMQEKLVPHMSEKESLIENSLKMIHGLKALQVPIVVTQQYTKGLGSTIPEINEAIGNFSYIEKMAFSCYREASFIRIMNRIGKRNVVIVGVEAHVCVLQTTLDLLYNNFNPVVVTDAISSRKPDDKKISLWRMRDVAAVMTTTESILLELCREAGTPEFKTISKLIK